MPVFDRTKVEKLLAAELNAAQESFRLAAMRTRDLAKEVPSGIPFPDSNVRLKIAGADQALAFQALQASLHEWTDFVTKGKVPQRFESDAPPAVTDRLRDESKKGRK